MIVLFQLGNKVRGWKVISTGVSKNFSSIINLINKHEDFEYSVLGIAMKFKIGSNN